MSSYQGPAAPIYGALSSQSSRGGGGDYYDEASAACDVEMEEQQPSRPRREEAPRNLLDPSSSFGSAGQGRPRAASISRERTPLLAHRRRRHPAPAAGPAAPYECATPVMGSSSARGGGAAAQAGGAGGLGRPRAISLGEALLPPPQDAPHARRLGAPFGLNGGGGEEYSAPVGGGGGGGFQTQSGGAGAADDGREGVKASRGGGKPDKGGFFNYIVYAVINIIISVPGLYGYAAVIFNHPVFADRMNALPKLVVFSSCVHQLGFTLFSSLPFAIGTVQDAGLIFLSGMSNIIAEEILNSGGTAEEVVSTTLVVLPLGTACLGLVLVVMGRCRLADVVSYLPMPVVGGYLAFIGYFCLMAGVALCISESMMELRDWAYLLDPRNLLLAFPGLAAGLVLTWISRTAENEMMLPAAMIAIPALFYAVIFATGAGIEGARDGGWVGEVMPPVPVTELFRLVDFSLVRWSLAVKCMATWVGMVFVVSFASCLDVAAISMDMGEALDTNRELATVGICNFMSGCTIGFTGSYIFSQTIFTYRTGCHSKWIGIFIMMMFVSVVVSTVNFLQVAPLFFLGSTLIFIGYDLLYEWLIEVRHKLLLTEYFVLLATFVAIHIIGIDAGILFGVIVAVVDFVFTTAKVSSLTRVQKRSRAVWKPEDWKLLDAHGYNPRNPKIVTFELKGSVFFGTSLQLLSGITDEIGLDDALADPQDGMDTIMASPHRGAYMLTRSPSPGAAMLHNRPILRPRPQFVVLDLADMSNLDASAARGCFLQLAKMCAKRGIAVCASGANPRVDWMLRSHEVSHGVEEEEEAKRRLLLGGSDGDGDSECSDPDSARPETHGGADDGKVLLFLTLYEALEFCEMMLIEKLTRGNKIAKQPSFVRLDNLIPPSPKGSVRMQPLSQVFSHVLGLSDEDAGEIAELDAIYAEETFKDGDVVFRKDTNTDAFYVVLRGGVATLRGESAYSLDTQIVSGAGPVKFKKSSSQKNILDSAEGLGEVKAILQVGAIFGFVDFLLDRPRGFSALSAQDGTVLAKLTHSCLDRIKYEKPELHRIVQNVLLQASAMELANCTCCE